MLAIVQHLQEEIANEVGAGTAVEEIDDRLIKSAPLDADERAALWLYAWSLESSRRDHDDLAADRRRGR